MKYNWNHKVEKLLPDDLYEHRFRIKFEEVDHDGYVNGACYLHYVNYSNYKEPMMLVQQMQSFSKLYNWPANFEYGIDQETLSALTPLPSKEQSSDSDVTFICGSCQKSDNQVHPDLKCLYCLQPCHVKCCRYLDDEDTNCARWLLGLTHPKIVVCESCDNERVAPNLCQCRRSSKYDSDKDIVGVLCKSPHKHFFGGKILKCIGCGETSHSTCVKWVPDKRKKSPFLHAPFCLSCDHHHWYPDDRQIQELNRSLKAGVKDISKKTFALLFGETYT